MTGKASSPAVHAAAARGFAAEAGAYALGRPDYPPGLDEWLRIAVGLGPGSRVVDLGAGTGKFLARLQTTGARVTAVEPMAAMRAELTRAWPEAVVLDGTAEAMPLPDASTDAIVCAQAFHWFATSAALAEMRRVLVPGGALALVWNVRDESVPWIARLTGIAAPYEGDTPRFHKGDWRRVFPAPGFSALEETVFAHAHAGPPERVIVDRFLSVSFIAALPADERAIVRQRLLRLIAEEPVLAGKCEVTLPYRTHAFRCIRR